MFSLRLCVFLLLPSCLFAQQKDPLKDFCRIHGHQTTIVDRKLYIDGGLVNWAPLSEGSINYTSTSCLGASRTSLTGDQGTWLRYGDLSVDYDSGFPQEYILNKTEIVPSVYGGILWSDTVNKIIYQYGGEYGNNKPEDFRMWFYDIVYGTWNMSNASTTDIRRASWGMTLLQHQSLCSDTQAPVFRSKTPGKATIMVAG